MDKSDKFVEQAPVLDNTMIVPGVFRLVVKSPRIAGLCVPGQFVMIRPTRMNDPLLRRPISIAGANASEGTLTLICRVVGHGTELLSKLKIGELLDIMGPLGRGFDLGFQHPLLVGGGMGLAPLLFVAQKFCPNPVEVLAGGRTCGELFWTDLFRESCQEVHVSTDDGSMGVCGTCVDALPALLGNGSFDTVLACGPSPMMRRVAEEAAKFGIRTQVSLEEHMACGLGACLSCTCSSPQGESRQICKDGPVFWSEEVEWE